MVVYCKNSRLNKEINSDDKLRRKYGQTQAGKIKQRLAEIEAFANLSQLAAYPPAKFHHLASDRRGQYAVSLLQSYRMILKPANNPVPQLPSGGVDLTKVTEVYITEIVDYH